VPLNPTSGDKNYVHEQLTPATSWTVVHNLGKRPAIQVWDSSGRMVEGDVVFDASNPVNRLTITFSAAFSGKAVCN
jgi:hypothetical protein